MKPRTAPHRRRINAWGFEGVSFPPPRPMRTWLAERLGGGERQEPVDPARIRVPEPRPLPDLPVPVSHEPLDRLLLAALHPSRSHGRSKQRKSQPFHLALDGVRLEPELRLRFAAEHGCRLAMMSSLPGSQSQKNAQKNGFEIAYTRTKWHLSV